MKPTMAEVMDCEFFPRPEWLVDDDCTGSCPCCEVVGQGFTIRVHCWRKDCASCFFAGVHVSGTLPKKDLRRIGRHVAGLLAERWSAEFAVVVE
jgi:hypothetical protein